MIQPGFKEHNIFLGHFYMYKKKNKFFLNNFMGIIVKYFWCLYAYFLWQLLCVFMYIDSGM